MFDIVPDLCRVPAADWIYFLTEHGCARGGGGKERAGLEVVGPGGNEHRDQRQATGFCVHAILAGGTMPNIGYGAMRVKSAAPASADLLICSRKDV